MNLEERQIKIEIPALKKEIVVNVNASTTVQDVIDYIVEHYNQKETEALKEKITGKLVLVRNKKIKNTE